MDIQMSASNQMTQPSVGQKEGRVLVQTKIMSELLTRVEIALSNLHGKISPILSPTPPMNETENNKVEDHGVAFASILEDANKRLRQLDNRILDMLDHVEV